MPGIPTLTLRQSTDRDLVQIAAFYVDNKSEYVAEREFDRMADAVRERRFFFVEDPDKSIVATSAVFDHRNGEYRQAGGSRVLSRYGGFGLHYLLHYARAIHVNVIDTDYKVYFAAIEESNARSIENAKRVGFIEWPKPAPDLRYDAMRTGKQFAFFLFPKENLAAAAKCLLANEALCKRKNRHTNI